MRIGELAKAAGVHVQTIRFYERRGLLPSPSRSSGGYRDYRKDDVPLVQFIKRVQAHGYTLEEIRELLALSEHGTHVSETVRDRAKKKVQQLEAEIVRLCGLRDWLKQFVSDSERGVVPSDCLVLRRNVTRAEHAPNSSSSTVASQTRSDRDSATGSERPLRSDGSAPICRRADCGSRQCRTVAWPPRISRAARGCRPISRCEPPPKSTGVIVRPSTRFQKHTLNLHCFSVTFALGDEPHCNSSSPGPIPDRLRFAAA